MLFVQKLDLNGDGVVTLDEFMEICQSVRQKCIHNVYITISTCIFNLFQIKSSDSDEHILYNQSCAHSWDLALVNSLIKYHNDLTIP